MAEFSRQGKVFKHMWKVEEGEGCQKKECLDSCTLAGNVVGALRTLIIRSLGDDLCPVFDEC